MSSARIGYPQQPQGGAPSVEDPTDSGGDNMGPGNAPEPRSDGFTGVGGGANGGNEPPQATNGAAI